MDLTLALFLKDNTTGKFQRTDLFNDETISITQVIQDVQDISKVFTDFSKSFSIPATSENNRLFKHYYNYDIDGGFDARVRIDGYIEIDSNRFNSGKIKLEGVDLQNNQPYAYRITYYGDTIKLNDLIGEDKLNALPLSAYNQIYNADSVKGKFASDPTTADVLVPFITHTNRYYYDSSTGHSEDDRNLFYQSGSTHNHGLLWSELKYAIRIDKIIRAIESQYGLTFSNDFFNSSNVDYYQLFMWLHRAKGNVQGAESGILPPELVTTWDFGSVFNVSWEYTIGTANITTSSTTDYRFIVYRNGELYYTSNSLNGSETNIFAFNGVGDYQFFIQSQVVITIDQIHLQVYSYDPEDPSYAAYSNFYASTFNTNNAFVFDIAQQIPEMKILDFLTGLFKMFNLTAYVENNIIVVKTLNDFYSTGNVHNITKYIKVDSKSVNVALPFKQVEFGYEDTKTLLALKHSQQFNYDWAKEIYNELPEIEGGVYKVTLPFSHMKFERIYDIFDNSVTDIQWGYSANDNFNAATGNYEASLNKPLLFYPIKKGVSPGFSFKKTTSTHEDITSYILPSNSVDLDPLVSISNINFKAELNEWTATNDFTDTLFSKYYQDYIMQVFNPKNRLTKIKAILPISIFMNLKLNDRFKIVDRIFRINKITTNLTNGESDIELLNEL
jgi:hypothetical protein